MPPSIVTVIQEDPRKTPRAVEALRIALGLSTGDNPLTIVLLKESPLLLSENLDDVQDLDILEKYLPSFKHLKTPFLVPSGARASFSLDEDFSVREVNSEEITSVIAAADRSLVF
jgi:sulfur relay (sulfurtransferase) DsrF/TusC family protein